MNKRREIRLVKGKVVGLEFCLVHDTFDEWAKALHELYHDEDITELQYMDACKVLQQVEMILAA